MRRSEWRRVEISEDTKHLTMCQTWYKVFYRYLLTESSQQPCQGYFTVLPISQIRQLRSWKWSDLHKGTYLIFVGIRVILLFIWLMMPDPLSGTEDSKCWTQSLSLWDISSIWVCLRVPPHHSLWKTAVPSPLGGRYTVTLVHSLLFQSFISVCV